jgi:hypothetical protein
VSIFIAHARWFVRIRLIAPEDKPVAADKFDGQNPLRPEGHLPDRPPSEKEEARKTSSRPISRNTSEFVRKDSILIVP